MFIQTVLFISLPVQQKKKKCETTTVVTTALKNKHLEKNPNSNCVKAGTMSKHLKYLYTFSEFVDIVEIKFDCFKACKKYNVGLIDIHKDIP